MPYAAIIQPPESDGTTLAQGTKVMVGDVQLEGVVKIELIGEVDSVWRAVIHVHPKMVTMRALADTRTLSYWMSIKARFLAWVRGEH